MLLKELEKKKINILTALFISCYIWVQRAAVPDQIVSKTVIVYYKKMKKNGKKKKSFKFSGTITTICVPNTPASPL